MTTRRPLLLLFTFVLAGCSFFSRSQSRFFSLDRIIPPAPAAATGLPVGIDSVELPPGFDRREIVVRKPDQQLEVRATDQWSASLQPLVLHTLAFDLAGRLPEGMVVLPGEARPAGALRSIDVIVEEIAAGPGRTVTLDVRWILREPGRDEMTHHERIAVDLASLESADVATGTSRALAALSDRMVVQLGAH